MATRTLAAIVIISFAFLVQTTAQSRLTIGDPAPELRYSQWLKGTPVKSLQNSNVYVIEFWATWCGTCQEAIPHMAELAKKYKDKATFIGVDIWDNGNNQTYETTLPKIQRFVTAIGDKMPYNIMVDNNDEYMVKNWVERLGILGVPSIVVVKNGKIQWIGRPERLDNIIASVIADTFNPAWHKLKYDINAAATAQHQAKIKAAYQLIYDALETKDYPKAFRQMDEAIKKLPGQAFSIKLEKFDVLLNNFSEAEALSYAKALNKEDKAFLIRTARTITNKNGLSKQAYLFAADTYSEALAIQPDSDIFDKMALAYSKAGNYQQAIAAEEKAIALAKKELTNPEFLGRTFDYTITDYQQTLKKYKAAAH